MANVYGQGAAKTAWGEIPRARADPMSTLAWRNEYSALLDS